jgi:hypothetical protein
MKNMELENMKVIWSEMSEQLDKQKRMTDEIILKMAHEKSSSRLGRIIRLEIFGVMVSIVMLLLLLVNFYKLDNWLNITGGIGTVLILCLGIGYSFKIIRLAQKIDVAKNSYGQTLQDFADLKKALGFYKKLSIAVNIIFPFFLLPVVFSLLLGKDLLADFSQFGRSLLICFALTPVVLYLLIKYYRRNVSQVKDALKDLEENQDNN